MHNAFFAGDFDATSLIFGTFVLFFLGLIIYLRREDRREGYPLEDEVTGRLEPSGGLLFSAKPKVFILPHDQGLLTRPNTQREPRELTADRASRAPGSPLEPRGEPLLAGVGPGAYAQRARKPDLMLNGAPKIAPLRAADGFSVASGDPDPRGMKVVGADRGVAGVVSDVWVDRAEYLIRYLEVALTPTGAAAVAEVRRVLVPMTMAVVERSRRTVRVDAVLGSQFAQAPTLEDPNQVTLYEEDRICAYFGGGFLYATPARSEPYL